MARRMMNSRLFEALLPDIVLSRLPTQPCGVTLDMLATEIIGHADSAAKRRIQYAIEVLTHRYKVAVNRERISQTEAVFDIEDGDGPCLHYWVDLKDDRQKRLVQTIVESTILREAAMELMK